jgi:hypothetical protein
VKWKIQSFDAGFVEISTSINYTCTPVPVKFLVPSNSKAKGGII